MDITEIAIEIHEKRSHPHEYGHRDCAVRLTATVGGQDDIRDVIEDLSNTARDRVVWELDAWVTEIDLARAAEKYLRQIEQQLRWLALCRSRGCVEKGAEMLRSSIHELPWAEQAAATERLEAAVLEAWERLPEAET